MADRSTVSRARLAAVGSALFYPLVAVVLLVMVWEPIALHVSVGFIPTPMQVWKDLVSSVQLLDTYRVILITLRRVVIAFVAAGIAGISLGVAMGLRKSVEQFAVPYVVVSLAIPGPVYVIMALLILGVNEFSSLLALIVAVTPFVTNIVFQGTMARDVKLDEMARHYQIRGTARIRHVIIPQIAPSVLAGARTSFALSWKLVVLMEALSRPDGIGAEIQHAFKLLRPAHVVAFTTLFMLVMFAIEVLGFKPLEKSLLRWRAQAR